MVLTRLLTVEIEKRGGRMSVRKVCYVMSLIRTKFLQWCPRVMAALALPVLIGHIYWAIVVDCATHFSRGGSFLVAIAVLSVSGFEDRMHLTNHMYF